MSTAFDAELLQLRCEIDQIDRMLLEAIVRRVSISTSIATLKASKDLPVLAPQREAEIIRDRCQLGTELGLPPECVARLFHSVLELCRAVSSDKMTDRTSGGGVHGTGENRSALSTQSAS
jgi:chorismate mutase